MLKKQGIQGCKQTRKAGSCDRRRLEVLLHLLKHGVVDVSDVTRLLDCHINLARGDIRFLASKCPYIQLIGGQVAASLLPPFLEDGLRRRIGEHQAEKLAIARKAVEFCSEGDVVFLGGGATVFFLAMELARMQMRNLVVLTSHVFTHAFLLTHISQVKIVGGELDKRVGSVTVPNPDPLGFQKEPITKVFVGVEGVSYQHGACCGTPDIQLQREACLRATERVVVLADHTKVHKNPGKSFITFSELQERKIPYNVIVNQNYKNDANAEMIRRALDEFPPGTVVLA